MPRTRQRKTSFNLAAFYDFIIVAAIVAGSFSLPGCNTFDSPHEDAEQQTATAGSRASEAPVAQALQATCNTISLNSQASDWFLDQTHPRAECFYTDIQGNWTCRSQTQNYSVTNYHPDDARSVERAVAPSQARQWRFECHYKSDCRTVLCKRFAN